MSGGRLVLTGGALRTGRRVLPAGWLALEGGRVAAVGAGAAPEEELRRAGAVLDTTGGTAVPGFVDLHCHGGGGASFGGAPGGSGPGTGTVEAAARAAATHRAAGTTTLVASLVTAPLARLREDVVALADLVADGLLAGVHLEGPWLSPRHPGAHDVALLRAPDPADVAALLGARPGAVRVVTLAPELDGGLDAVRRVVDAGAVAAFGHSDADAATTTGAVDAGVRLATHLFNAMRPLHHRDPGPVPALLADERVTVELIADGAHLHPLVLATAARAAGTGRTAFVTDAMAAAGCGDGRYRLGALEVDVRGGLATLAAGGAIAGGTATTQDLLRHAVLEAGLGLDAALAALTAVPAAVLGLADTGHLEPGARADVVVLGPDLRVREVVARGERVTAGVQAPM
ncbi:N-acetylglucosamine-6-phosphate deacetylase [Kineococcus sp. NUM-3379]